MKPSIIIITIAVYVALLVVVARLAGRGADNSGFFVGARRSKWWMAMIAMVGGAMSGVTFVSVPGMVISEGFSYMQMALGFVVGYFIIGFVLVPLFYRMGLYSIYGYLEERFDAGVCRTGAGLFFVSKLLGASVRLFLICAVLQPLLYDPLGVPFVVNCTATVLLVWGYTFSGGVKSLIATDVLRTGCLVGSIIGAMWVVTVAEDLSFGEMVRTVRDSELSQMFFTDDVRDDRYFPKQFFAAIFLVIAMTGLDQEMMQRTLSCRNARESQKNMMSASIIQAVIIFVLLVLGVLLYTFAERRGIALPADSTDAMFPTVATSSEMPLAVGILFVLGLVASTYSAAGSAMTALTTSFTVDILGGAKRYDEHTLTRVRKRVHICMAVAMAAVVYALHLLGNGSVIDAVYTLGSYTYGPILGLFCFGLATRRSVRSAGVPMVAMAAPLICFIVQHHSEQWFDGYRMGYELLLLNALLTLLGMWLLSKPQCK
jgi:Na+/proline symporter